MNLHYPGQTTLTNLVPRILGALHEHGQYWELCCGTCQLFKRKIPAVPSILIDKNAEIAFKSLDGFQNGAEYQFIQADIFSVLEDLIENRSFQGIELSADALVYIDPPWRVSKMGNPKKLLYDYNLTDEDLLQLLQLAKQLPCKAAILHYQDEIFDEVLTGWHRLDTKVSYRGRVVTVSLYCNYDFRNVRAHVVSKAGKNRTDRQRIKRKAQRWVKNFERLPVYERQAIFELLKEKY